ncbi:MAG: PQQ-dependent sugar dehydrogenase [Pirellulaceae bacterium]|nr:PQQ-dependent sugar dehydrogenase [Pirellulaceae bacterium]
MRQVKPRKLNCLLVLMNSLVLLVPLALGETAPNSLTRSEVLSDWKLLFDGTSMDQWRNYQKEGISEGWKVADGALVRDGINAGDLVTKKKFKYFELSLEYNISEGGNSGLLFHVTEDNPKAWNSGPEVQIQDNIAGHDKQLAGWLYQLYQPAPPSWTKDQEAGVLDATRPAGQWNQIFLRIAPNQCEVSMNGQLYYRFNLGDKKWKALVAESKFAKFPGFGAAGEGHICLQDHGNLVSFRSVKVRELADDGTVKQPIDGVLNLKSGLAFPKLKWDGWEGIDEDGNVNKPLRILELTYAQGDGNRLFAADQQGMIFTFENRPDVEQSKLFLDLRSKVSRWFDQGADEQGLLGLAMHPKFKVNGEFFVCYTQRDNDHSIVSRFRVSKDNPNVADPNSEEVLLDLPQPFKNHNGGSIEFGPDGYLYVAFGDGGLRNDPHENGQNRSQLLGSILRLDINTKANGLNYGIPADNPFVAMKNMRPEIFAYGLRNPWRIAFDRKTGRLWCGDVGQELWEEIDVITKGGNYGWSNREGYHAFGNRPSVVGVSTPIDPIWEYDHSVGKSITGGRVYNPSRIPQLTGKYIYADYVRGSVWALTYDPSTGKSVRNEQVIESGIPVLAFGEDQNGEIFYSISSPRGDCIFRFEAN